MFTIEQLKQLKESEDHVEFKKVKGVILPIMAEVKPLLQNEDVVF